MNLAHVKIEKGIPNTTRRIPVVPYPFDKMEIGDSFFLPTPEGDNVKKFRSRIASTICYIRTRLGLNQRFSTSVVDGGVRVWGTE